MNTKKKPLFKPTTPKATPPAPPITYSPVVQDDGEETAEQLADRLGLETRGRLKQEFRYLEQYGFEAQNSLLAHDWGLVRNEAGDLFDFETGELMTELGSIYEQ